MEKCKNRILWIDGLGGLIVGVLVVFLHPFLADWYGLPAELVLLMGMTNCGYGCYSGFLAKRCECSLQAIVFLVFANFMWMGVCLFMWFIFRERMTVWGQIVVLGEGIYVGVLAGLEWSWRKFLITRACELPKMDRSG